MVAEQNPDDHGRQIAAWQKILADPRFHGTDAEAEANRQIEAIRARRDGENAAKRAAEYAEARKRSEGLLAGRDYLEAAKALREFAGFHAGSAEAGGAEARAREIDELCAAVLTQAEAESAKALESGAFQDAVGVLDGLSREVKSAGWLAEVPGKIEGVRTRIKELFDADRKKAAELIQSGRHSEAEQALRALERRFRGTPHADEVPAMRESMAAFPALLGKVRAAITAQAAPREITFKMEAALFPGVTWRVVRATEDKLYLAGRHSGMELESPLNWGTMSARDAYGIFLMYLENPGPEDHRMLAFFCESRGLAQEAEEHRKKAQ
jgi:hypothetical protein